MKEGEHDWGKKKFMSEEGITPDSSASEETKKGKAFLWKGFKNKDK